jgi:hypothetical protein
MEAAITLLWPVAKQFGFALLLLLAFICACALIAWAFDEFVTPLFMTPDEISQRQARRLQEKASADLNRGRLWRVLRVFNI